MTITKRVGEKIPIAINFSTLFASLTTAQAIQIGNVKIFDPQKVDVSMDILVSTALSSSRVDIVVQGGRKGNRYKIIFLIQTQDYIFEEHVSLAVN